LFSHPKPSPPLLLLTEEKTDKISKMVTREELWWRRWEVKRNSGEDDGEKKEEWE
jgi:hypothetical protein